MPFEELGADALPPLSAVVWLGRDTGSTYVTWVRRKVWLLTFGKERVASSFPLLLFLLSFQFPDANGPTGSW